MSQRAICDKQAPYRLFIENLQTLEKLERI